MSAGTTVEDATTASINNTGPSGDQGEVLGMNAVLKKIGPKQTKQICGIVVQDGIGRITLAVTDKSGSRRLRGFDKSKYTISYYN